MEDSLERAKEPDLNEKPVLVDTDVNNQKNKEGGLEVAGKRCSAGSAATGQQPFVGQPLLDGRGSDKFPEEFRGVHLHKTKQ